MLYGLRNDHLSTRSVFQMSQLKFVYFCVENTYAQREAIKNDSFSFGGIGV